MAVLESGGPRAYASAKRWGVLRSAIFFHGRPRVQRSQGLTPQRSAGTAVLQSG